MVDQLMQIESRPKTKMQWRSQLWSARKTAWTDLNTKLLGLQDKANTLLRTATWDVNSAVATGTWTASSSDQSKVLASVNGTPAAGSYAVNVTQLARAEISASTGALGAATSGVVATGTWYEANNDVVEGDELLTNLKTGNGNSLGLAAGSVITMSWTVNGVASSDTFTINSLLVGGDGTTVNDFKNWIQTAVGNGATATINNGKVEITTAAGTSNAISALGFTAVSSAGTAHNTFNSSVSATGFAVVTAASNGGIAANDTLTITSGLGSWNVALAAGDQKSSIVTKINAVAGIGVTASLVNGEIRLQSNATGASAGFTVTSTGNAATQLAFTETQSAQDATYSVNGTEKTSASNSAITTGVTGLELNLLATGSSTLTVAQGTGSQSKEEVWRGQVKTKITEFVNQYNAVLDQVYQKTQAETRVANPKTQSEFLQGPLARDMSYSRVSVDLRSLMGSSVSGLAAGSNTLADIGITSTFSVGGGSANGRLSIDDAKLTAALTSDPAKVQAILTSVGTGSGVTATDGFARRISEQASIFRNGGVVDTALTGAGNRIKDIQSAIDRTNERLDRRRASLERTFAALEGSVGRINSQNSWVQGQLARLSAGY